jgi:hypothetical protein
VEDNSLQGKLATQLEFKTESQADFDACSKAFADFEPTYQEALNKRKLADEALLDAKEQANRLGVKFNRDGIACSEFRRPETELAAAEYNAALFNSKLCTAHLMPLYLTYDELETDLCRAKDELKFRTDLVDLYRAQLAMQEMEAIRDACPEWIAYKAAQQVWMETETHKDFSELEETVDRLERSIELHYESIEW